jgi:hypothetical protein
MADYKESPIAGTVYSRCHTVLIENTRGRPPAAQFIEERVIVLEDGAEIRQNLGPLAVAFEPAKVITLRDPDTLQPTGQTSTYAAVYQLLFSAYLDAALARDAEAVTPEPEQPA